MKYQFELVQFTRKFVGAYPTTTYIAPAVQVREGEWRYPFAFAQNDSIALERGAVNEREHKVTVVGEVTPLLGGKMSFPAWAEAAYQLQSRVGHAYEFTFLVDDCPGSYGNTFHVGDKVGFKANVSTITVDGDTYVDIVVDPSRFIASLPASQPAEPVCSVPERDMVAIAKLIDRLLDGNWRDDHEACAVFEALERHIDMIDLLGDKTSPLPF